MKTQIEINDVTVWRNHSGNQPIEFAVTLSHAAAVPVTVHVATNDRAVPAGTQPGDRALAFVAVAGIDYDAKSEDITFAPGETSKPFSVNVYGSPVVGPDKFFEVSLSESSVKVHRVRGAGIMKYTPGA